VEIVDEIAGLEHVDVVFAASSDIGSFTGLRQGDRDYEALLIRDGARLALQGEASAGPRGVAPIEGSE
jgi:hypothetical protein